LNACGHAVERHPAHAGSRPGRALVGIISLDDLVQLLAEEMGELGRLIAREQAHEAAMR
jgi:hypothetical protein